MWQIKCFGWRDHTANLCPKSAWNHKCKVNRRKCGIYKQNELLRWFQWSCEICCILFTEYGTNVGLTLRISEHIPLNIYLWSCIKKTVYYKVNDNHIQFKNIGILRIKKIKHVDVGSGFIKLQSQIRFRIWRENFLINHSISLNEAEHSSQLYEILIDIPYRHERELIAEITPHNMCFFKCICIKWISKFDFLEKKCYSLFFGLFLLVELFPNLLCVVYTPPPYLWKISIYTVFYIIT